MVGAGAGVLVRVLGAVVAERDGAVLDLGGRKQRAVLALLIAARTHVVPVDRIIEELWQGEAPPTAMATLQTYVSRLRRVLEPEHGRRSSTVLVSVSPGYALRLPGDGVDAWRFEELVRGVEAEADLASRLASLDEALRLWRGEAFAEFADEQWAVPEVARLSELRLHARELVIDAALRAGGYPRAVIEGEALVRDAPLREQAWRLLALAQYAADRQADALATLRRARDTLADELGLDPGPVLRELEKAILTQTVVLPTGPVEMIRPLEAAAPIEAPAATTPSAAVAAVRLPALLAPNLLVGRESEAGQLFAAAERTSAERAGIAVVSGEPGAGKSRLLRHLVDELFGHGWLVAVGRCPEVDGSPPAWAWAEVFRSLAGQVPVREFADALAPLLRDDAPPPSGDAAQARFRMHQAAADWLSSLEDRPIAIVLDDVHRADAETRRLLLSLLEKVRGARLFVAISHRQEQNEELTQLLADIAAMQPERVALGGLDSAAAEELVAGISGAFPSPAILEALLERTDGNPFYLWEFARLLGSVGPRELLKTVPAGVADVVRQRLRRLPESAQAILRLASAIGRTVDIDVLVAAAPATDDVVYDALEAGEIAGVLTDFGPSQVRFTHVLVRDTLYSDVAGTRLRPMHAAIAAAVEAVTPSDVTALAHHLALSASRATADKAVRYCLAAAEQAESRLAYDRAVELYRRALDCLNLTEPDPRQRLDVLLRLIPALVLSGDTTSFISLRREAVALARELGDDHLLGRAISCWFVTPWWVRDSAYIEVDFVNSVTASLASAELHDAERAQLLSASLCEALVVEIPMLAETVGEQLAVARRSGDPEILCKALFIAAQTLGFDHHPAECDAIRVELREIAERQGLLSFQLVAAVFDVMAAVTRGEVHAARVALDESFALASKLELRWVRLVLDDYEGRLAMITGDHERAEAIVRAVAESTRQFDPESGVADLSLADALLALRFAQGRAGEIVDIVRAAFETLPEFYAFSLICCLLATGEETEARAVYEAAPVTLSDPHFRVSRWVIGARAALMLGDDPRVAQLYENLLPYEDQIGGASKGSPLEPVAHTLGAMALHLNNPDQARRHLNRALDIATHCGNLAWVRRIEMDSVRCANRRPNEDRA